MDRVAFQMYWWVIYIQPRINFIGILSGSVGAVASGSSDRIQALGGNIVLCSWARHLGVAVPLFTLVYIWVPVNLMLKDNPALN